MLREEVGGGDTPEVFAKVHAARLDRLLDPQRMCVQVSILP